MLSSSQFKTSRSNFLILFWYADLFNDFSDSGIEFQIETPILGKDFFIFSVLEVFTVKHSFEDDLVL